MNAVFQRALASMGFVGTLSLALTSQAVLAGSLIISGNDGKLSRTNGAYIVDAQPMPDSLVVLDAKHFPLRILGQTTDVHHGVVAPPTSVALSADEKIALLAVPNMVNPKDVTKMLPEAYLQVLSIEQGKPTLIKRIDLPSQPLSVSINHQGTLALTVDREGNLGIFTIRGTEVALKKTLAIGTAKSRLSAVAITPDSRWALVTFRGEDQLAVLPINGDDVGMPAYTLPMGRNPYVVLTAANGKFAAVANLNQSDDGVEDSVSIIDLSSAPFKEVSRTPVPRGPESIAISPDSKWVAASSINGSNEASDSHEFHDFGLITLFRVQKGNLVSTGTAKTGHNTQGALFTPDSKHLLVQDYMEQSISSYKVTGKGPIPTGMNIAIPGRPASLRSAE